MPRGPCKWPPGPNLVPISTMSKQRIFNIACYCHFARASVVLDDLGFRYTPVCLCFGGKYKERDSGERITKHGKGSCSTMGVDLKAFRDSPFTTAARKHVKTCIS